MNNRQQLIDKINRQADPADPEAPSPIVSLEDFFEGNDDLASIGCNLAEHPGTDGFYRVLRDVRARPNVQDVLVEIYEVMEGEDEWPFSERVYVLTSAEPDEVRGWLAALDPSEIEEGWASGASPAQPLLQPRMRVLGVWWD
ncbi:MAG: hypothetical protein KC464_00060 [Myxococcales bacterium]|nr:hypothetical protein [Myxococcales bacterium]